MTVQTSWTRAMSLHAHIERAEDVRVAVVIPCYRAAKSIASVVSGIQSEVWRIYCVDDASPDSTKEEIRKIAEYDSRIRLVERERNGGVGAAVVDGFKSALADGAMVIVKIDSDGQMNPAFIPDFVRPIIEGEADYVKGNRFFSLDDVMKMPGFRLAGNAGLSFLTKISSGYWDIFDPTNGYIAIHANIVRLIPLGRIHKRYFFESDLLFRLSTLRARVVEIPIETVYQDEESHLNEWKCLLTFPLLHSRNFLKRIFYNYILRNFSTASVSLIAGALLFCFGCIFGTMSWLDSVRTGHTASAGTVMLSALPLLLGFQLLLNFIVQDVALTPATAIHRRLASKSILTTEEAKRKDHL